MSVSQYRDCWIFAELFGDPGRGFVPIDSVDPADSAIDAAYAVHGGWIDGCCAPDDVDVFKLGSLDHASLLCCDLVANE